MLPYTLHVTLLMAMPRFYHNPELIAISFCIWSVVRMGFPYKYKWVGPQGAEQNEH